MDVKGIRLGKASSSWLAAAFLGLFFFASGANAAVTLRVDARPVSDPIEVFANVTNSSGGPVSGLTAADFQVLVDGTAVQSVNFSLPPSQGNGKVSVVFAMDMSQTVQQAALDAMRSAVTEFIQSMRPGDYAAIVKFNEKNPDKASVVVPWTPIDDGAGDSALISGVNAPYPGSGSNILDGTALAIDQIRNPSVSLPSGPKAVVLISDGRDNASTTTQTAVVDAANAASVPIFTIGVGNVGGSLLQDLASGTGGAYLPAPTGAQISEAYQRIANQLNNEYVLTFESSITDCGSHKLEVNVTGQSTATANFTRCDSTGGGGGGGGTDNGGGDGGGGGALGLFEVLAGLSLVAVGQRRLRRKR